MPFAGEPPDAVCAVIRGFPRKPCTQETRSALDENAGAAMCRALAYQSIPAETSTPKRGLKAVYPRTASA